MTNLAVPTLDQVTLEVKYGFGHRYLDRCGQTLVDIEQQFPEWSFESATPDKGVVRHHKTQTNIVFNNASFNATSSSPGELMSLAKSIHSIWDIVRANLGLSDYYRIGARFQMMLAKPSIDDAKRAVLRSSLATPLPKALADKQYKRLSEESVITIQGGQVEYRIALLAATRTENVRPSPLLHLDPRNMPKNLRGKMKDVLAETNRYIKSPMFGVVLDIDAAVYDPEKVSPRDFLLQTNQTIEDEFLWILKELA